jgi:hypothetical protein
MSRIEIQPHEGSPYSIPAWASKYSIEQNASKPVLQERIRFRYDVCEHTARLGDRVVYDGKEWVLGHAQVFSGAGRIVIDAMRQSLDTSQCTRADLYLWESQYDCNAGESPTLVQQNLIVAPWQDNRSSLNLNSSRQTVDNYRVYMKQCDAADLSHLNMLKIDDLELKIQSVHNQDQPGELAWVIAQDYGLTMAQL